MIQSILLLASAGMGLLIAALALKVDKKSRQNRFFAYFLVFSAIWAIGDALMLFSSNATIVAYGTLAYMIAPLFVSFFILLFAFNYPAEKKISNKKYLLPTVPLIIYSLLITLNINWFISVAEPATGVNNITPNPLGYFIYTLYFNGLFFWYVIELFLKYRKTSGQERKMALSFIYSISIATTFALISNVLIPNLTGVMRFVWIGPLSLSIFSVFISFAIIKHRFLNIRLIVARSFAYVLSVFIIGLVYGLLAFNLINNIAFSDTAVSFLQQTAYTLLAVVIAFSFQPIKRFFDRISNKLFYRDAYEPQELLDELNKELISNIEVEKLLQKSARVINKYIKSEFCVFEIKKTDTEQQRIIGPDKDGLHTKRIKDIRLLAPKVKVKTLITDELTADQVELQKKLRRNDIAALVRLTDQPEKPVEGIGHIILGFKKSGNPYSSQDIKTLEIIADELVIAIQNALRFEEIQNFSKTLQGKVDDATHKLRKANEKLVALDQTKDDFISMASHQLRTPLTSVKGYVSMVLEGDAGKINDKQKELLNQSFVSSQRMVYLIADLLNVSRLRTGKFIIDPKPTNLADVVEGEISQLQETAEGRGLKLIFDKPKNFPTLMLDETKTRQVIMNFADNAIYYTPSGGKINVVVEDKAKTVEFRVEDDGIGVPVSEQHHLFGKFYRAGNAKKARPDGTGLGLFMAKKVIVAQKGSIIFRSKEGHGSTFGFSFAKEPLSPDNFKGFSKDEDGKPAHSPKKAISKSKKIDTKSK